VKAHGHLRTRVVLILALCAAFTSTPALAEYIASVRTACHGQMPCCPVSGGGMGCSHPHCGAVARIHAELVSIVRETSALNPAVVSRGWMPRMVGFPGPLPVAFDPHLAPVFRLKEDLRI